VGDGDFESQSLADENPGNGDLWLMGPLDGEEQSQTWQEGLGTRCCSKIPAEGDGRFGNPRGGGRQQRVTQMGQAGGWLA
jgi:hypothetical protein